MSDTEPARPEAPKKGQPLRRLTDERKAEIARATRECGHLLAGGSFYHPSIHKMTKEEWNRRMDEGEPL